MKPAIGFGIGDQAVAFVIVIPAVGFPLFCVHGKPIFVDKILAGVIRRVDINHLDLAQPGFLQQFQRIEIIALDKQVFGAVKVDAFFAARPQGFVDWRVGGEQCFALAGPVQAVAFLWAFDDVV